MVEDEKWREMRKLQRDGAAFDFLQVIGFRLFIRSLLIANHHQLWHTFPFNCWQKVQEENKNNPKLVLNCEVYTIQRQQMLFSLCAAR